jgi:hypothetical protein
MGNKQAGRRRSGVMPAIKIRPDNGYARITIGGVRHALGKSPGGKVSIEQEREAARLWLEHLNGSPQVFAPVDDQDKGPTIAELCIAVITTVENAFC